MNLVVKSPVWDDLREIGSRIAAENPEAAERFLAAVEEAFDHLRRHPYIGRLRSFSLRGVRSWLMPRHRNYLIFYVVTGTDLQILAVLNGGRDLSSVLGERL